MKTLYIYFTFTPDSNSVFHSKAFFSRRFSHLFFLTLISFVFLNFFYLKRVDGCPPCLFFQLCLLSLLPSIFGSLGDQKLMVNEQIQQSLALLHQGM